MIQKARQTAATRDYEAAIGPMREMITKMSAPLALPGPAAPAPAVVKQLTRPEQAMVADLQRRLVHADDPALREELNTQIARVAGLAYA